MTEETRDNLLRVAEKRIRQGSRVGNWSAVEEATKAKQAIWDEWAKQDNDKLSGRAQNNINNTETK